MPCSRSSSTPTTDLHQKSFRIKHDDDKLFTKFLSKESCKANPSFRVYYNDVSSAVPFRWETRPGTPKHTMSHNCNLPPLTPPPSYYTNNSKNSQNNNYSRSLLHTLLRRMSRKKVYSTSSSSLSSISTSLSWSSSSRSSFSDPIITPKYMQKRRRFSSWGSSFDAKAMDDQVCKSASCFGIGKGNDGKVKSGSYSVFIVKKALLSIVGRGSATN